MDDDPQTLNYKRPVGRVIDQNAKFFSTTQCQYPVVQYLVNMLLFDRIILHYRLYSTFLVGQHGKIFDHKKRRHQLFERHHQ